MTKRIKNEEWKEFEKDLLPIIENCPMCKLYGICKFHEDWYYKVKEAWNKTRGIECPKCSSFKIIKRGNRYGKFTLKQRYECKSCNYRFIINADRLRIPENVRKFVFNKLKTGKKSTREIAKEVQERFGIKISHVSIVRMFRDTKRYFGKEVKKKKINVKKTLPSFNRILNGKTISHPETKFNRKILTIEK